MNKLDSLTKELILKYPFYKDYAKGASVSFFDLPLTDKKLITMRRNEFEILKGEVNESYTSGSTGTPFHCIKSKEEQLSLAFSLYKHRRKWGLPFKNHSLLLSNRVLEEEHALSHYTKQVVNKEPHMIQGRASALYQLALYIQRNEIQLKNENLLFIQNWGEPLSEKQIRVVQEVFDVPVVDYYGLEELWCIAFTNEDGDLEIDEHVHVEIINPETLKAASEGEYGEIVVTSFIMKSIPFVRYRTGDIGKIEENKQGKKILTLFPIRHSHVIKLKDRNVNASIFRYLDSFFFQLTNQGITQYQIVQQSLIELCFQYIGTVKDKTFIEKKLNEFVRSHLGSEMRISVQEVDELVHDPISGKTHVFIELPHEEISV
ncbi:hypothetical protein [Fictibacillus norfolkensis]|uniref:Phenylacetate-CoA ligase n=1 Tax=Fictibacillus norfolkensis TaxID=2762233 RepID=A0ABR8SGY9_9BACL|nr:hypothetical protein [Fictibacillus norfolkensis]MBD7962756.1 hypothetical protein [Fictibacillus norfolkensis]